ncbi:hypothetical protein GIHI108528_11720 [Gillisia hiemivivida]
MSLANKYFKIKYEVNFAELLTINLDDDPTKVFCCEDVTKGYVKASNKDHELINIVGLFLELPFSIILR